MEDPLRIIRALRFTSQLGFSVENDTLQYMIQVKSEIENLAVERITSEITKLFAGQYAADGVAYLKSTGVYNHLPILSEYPDLLSRLPELLQPLHSFGEVIALFHYLNTAVPVAAWIKAWKCSNRIQQEANELVQALFDYKYNGLNKWGVYQLDASYYQGFNRLISILYPEVHSLAPAINELSRKLPIRSKKDLALNGNDLIALFPQAGKGPWLRDTISRMEQEVVSGNVINSKYALKEWLTCNPPEIN